MLFLISLQFIDCNSRLTEITRLMLTSQRDVGRKRRKYFYFIYFIKYSSTYLRKIRKCKKEMCVLLKVTDLT